MGAYWLSVWLAVIAIAIACYQMGYEAGKRKRAARDGAQEGR